MSTINPPSEVGGVICKLGRLSYQDKITAFRHLVSSGAAVNITDELGNTLPLHGAADKGFLEIVQFLIEQIDVNIEAVTSQGYMPLQLAACYGHLPIV